MRPPWRAVVDDHVDRPQVGARRRVEPSGTNCPNASALVCGCPCAGFHPSVKAGRPGKTGPQRNKRRPLRGGAPLPIPNREVKPRRDDDTAGDRGKVVRRPPTTETLPEEILEGFAVFIRCSLPLFFLLLSIPLFFTNFLLFLQPNSELWPRNWFLFLFYLLSIF